METTETLNEDLLRVNTALQRLIAGEAVREFEVGTGSAMRRYKYGEVTLEALRAERDAITQRIKGLNKQVADFRPAYMNTSYRKL